MRKILLIIFLFLATTIQSQVDLFGFKGSYQYALDFDGSTEYLSTTPALRLTGEYSLYDNFSDGDYNGWTVSSGAYSVVDSVPLSGGTKSLKCTTAGIISIPCNQAYGSWEFDVYKGGASNAFISYFLGSTVPSTGAFPNSSYSARILDDERLALSAYTVAGAFSSNLCITALASPLLNSTWYRIKITRNTNGQFYFYIKGGTFGSDYVLVSVTGGLGTNPVTDNTYTSSNYFVLDLDANDMIANVVCQQGEGSLDLNSYERIYHSDNRNFTKTGGLAWAGAGTHSIDTTSTDKRTGTYSGRVISTGAGDSTTNYISLPAVNFDTLKTDANGVYEKYTLEGWARGVGILGADTGSLSYGWTASLGGWVIANDTATATATSNSMTKTIGATLNNTYKITFKATVTSGTVQPVVGGYTGGTVINTTGSYTQYITATNASSNTTLYFVGNNFTGKVTNITCQKITQPSITLRIGNQTKTITGISCVPSTFTKFVFNFQSNSLVSNQDIKLWINQADTVYVDDVSLTKSYDMNVNIFLVSNSTNVFKYILDYGAGGSGLSNKGWAVYSLSAGSIIAGYYYDGTNTATSARTSSNSYTNFNLTSWGYDRIVNLSSYKNGTIGTTSSLIGQGNANIVRTFRIACYGAGVDIFTGQIGHIQITKFTDISQSNVNSTTLTTAYTRGKLIQNEWIGGSPVEVAFYDWKGSTTNEILSDKSGTGNNLTGTNITIDDRVKVKSKFK